MYLNKVDLFFLKEVPEITAESSELSTRLDRINQIQGLTPDLGHQDEWPAEPTESAPHSHDLDLGGGG